MSERILVAPVPLDIVKIGESTGGDIETLLIGRYSRYRRPYPQPAYSSYDEEFDILQDELLRNFDRKHFRDKVESAKMKEDLLRFFDRRRFNDRPEPEHFNDEDELDRMQEDLHRFFERERLNPSRFRDRELFDKVQRQLEQLAEWERMNNRRRFPRKV
uniref:Uncharacterized protein n=1 Tax=Haemonchus contortus TaxID=6289 RepID=W6NBX5_HAECO